MLTFCIIFARDVLVQTKNRNARPRLVVPLQLTERQLLNWIDS